MSLVPVEDLEVRGALPNPDSQVLGRMMVDEFLGKLPEGYRLLFLMKYSLDLSCEEMAEFLSEPVGTIKGNLYRAREILKQAVESSGQGAEGKPREAMES